MRRALRSHSFLAQPFACAAGSRSLAILALGAWLAGAVADCAHAREWTVRRFDGRDHVPVREVLEFYQPAAGMPAPPAVFKQNARDAVLEGLRAWLAFPVIECDGELWISRLDLSRTVDPLLRPQMVAPIEPPLTVVLDPGHGGQDQGAASVYQYEKNFALDLARRVRDVLRNMGIRVVMTRNSDVFVELDERARLAAREKRAIFVSLHFNAAPNRAAQGIEIFSITPRGAPSTAYDELFVRDMVNEPGNRDELASLVLAKSIYHALHGRLTVVDRGIKRARFAVLRQAGCPAVLVEGGFLTNPMDARRVASPEWRTRAANAIAEGIVAYRELATDRTPPPLASQLRKRPATAALTPAPTPTPATTPSVNLRALPAP